MLRRRHCRAGHGLEGAGQGQDKVRASITYPPSTAKGGLACSTAARFLNLSMTGLKQYIAVQLLARAAQPRAAGQPLGCAATAPEGSAARAEGTATCHVQHVVPIHQRHAGGLLPGAADPGLEHRLQGQQLALLPGSLSSQPLPLLPQPARTRGGRLA